MNYVELKQEPLINIIEVSKDGSDWDKLSPSMKEALQYLKDNEEKTLFPEKYELSMESYKRVVEKEISNKIQNSPDLKLKDIIAFFITELPGCCDLNDIINKAKEVDAIWQEQKRQKAIPVPAIKSATASVE